MTNQLKTKIKELLVAVGVEGQVELTTPPNAALGDFAFGCFPLAKARGKSPAVIAEEVAVAIGSKQSAIIERVEAAGPYVNFYLRGSAVAELVLTEMTAAGENFGRHTAGAGKKILVEFAHPNTHKAFHIGHLRNIITGESIARLYENGGFTVKRVNYQGDVGMHIAKCLWGIEHLADEYRAVAAKSLPERVSFLGQAYALGSQTFETDETVKAEVIELNDKIYSDHSSIQDLYLSTRAWSLEYFDAIYARLGTKFDRLYFESEVFERGLELVHEFLDKGVFKPSDGAIIFEGSKHGLHDRVFVNSKGFPTYEGKEVGLAELQFGEHHPDKIVHITGKEQTDYFKVVFKAIEQVFPATAAKEEHITYGWVRLKHGKMSSRTGAVVLGEWLLDEVDKKISEIMAGSMLADKAATIKTIGLAAAKYSMLKTGVSTDIAFDFDESVSTNGNSGPYLLYIVARIHSILRKAEKIQETRGEPIESIGDRGQTIEPAEKKLLIKLAEFPEVTEVAFTKHDPSQVAVYLFDLAQAFNTFYNDCPVLGAPEPLREFRLMLIQSVLGVMEHGLNLLGIATVKEM